MFSDFVVEQSKNLFYSSLPSTFDTRPAEVITFIPTEYKILTLQLNDYSKKLSGKDKHRLLKNYINIDFFEFPFVTILKKDNKIVGFTTGYTRDFYRTGDIRILNRYYQDKNDLRVNFTREILRPTTLNIILQQLEMSQRLGFDNCFISREPRTNTFLKRFVDEIDKRTGYTWEYKLGPFLVAPDPSTLDCWQSVAVTNLKNLNTESFWEHWRTK